MITTPEDAAALATFDALKIGGPWKATDGVYRDMVHREDLRVALAAIVASPQTAQGVANALSDRYCRHLAGSSRVADVVLQRLKALGLIRFHRGDRRWRTRSGGGR